MKKAVKLPLVNPVYSTYHIQGTASSIIAQNQSIRNWYLNEAVVLNCTRKFLIGAFSSPELTITNSGWKANPYIETFKYRMKHIGNGINTVVQNLLDDGCYVYVSGIDDYYIDGKSWYKERHLIHDALIFGYDQEKKTYSIYAYDKNWVYNKFEIPQKSLTQGKIAAFRQGHNKGYISGMKPKMENVEFSANRVVENIKVYLDSSLKKYPKTMQGKVRGVAVHDYVAMYIDKLYDGSIPYHMTDWRIFRLIWEHKKVMLERLEKVEETLNLNKRSSKAYAELVEIANLIRMMYATHCIAERNNLLPQIKDKLLYIKKREKAILKRFIAKVEEVMNDETMELHKKENA